MLMRLITADDVCLAVESVLSTHLAATIAATGWGDLPAVRLWDQVPDLDALAAPDMPAGAIESPGLSGTPVPTVDGWGATWRVVVGIYDTDETYRRTASRARRWAAAIRATVLAHDTLDGLARSVEWVSESYAQRPRREQAQTLGGCAVSFDVTVENVVEVPILPPGETVPPVTTTHTAVTAVTIT